MSNATLHRNKRGTATFTPLHGTASNYRWQSSSPGVATITNNGSNVQEIVALANGTTTISCIFDGATLNMIRNKDLDIVDPGADDGFIDITENP